MAILEEAKLEKEELPVTEETLIPQNRRSFWDVLNRAFTSPYVRAAGTTAAAFAVSTISAIVTMRHTY